MSICCLYLNLLKNTSNLGKQSCNTIKTLSVIDRNGSFRFVHTGRHGGANDRDQFTSSCLYTSQADNFTDEQFVVADGIYGGNGKTMVSYTAIELKRDPDGSRANFNTSITVQYIYTIFNLPFRSITESVLIVLQLCLPKLEVFSEDSNKDKSNLFNYIQLQVKVT